jgi:hypothetical protein
MGGLNIFNRSVRFYDVDGDIEEGRREKGRLGLAAVA